MDVEYELSDAEFAKVKTRIYQLAGISLSDAKRTLVVSRLSRILRAMRIGSFDAYVDFLDHTATETDIQTFINALTTNLTRFYREEHHFAHLVEYVGELMAHDRQPRANGRRRLRIWSAGCSTGQEAYTIAMCLLDAHPQLKQWDFRVLATDIDTAVVDKAAAGRYPEAELAGLSRNIVSRFKKQGDGTVLVPPDCRATIAFKPLNLLGQWPFKGPFDAIFCRNVTIYFDKPTQRDVFKRFGQVLTPGGFLYIGHSENMPASDIGFSLTGKTIYRRAVAQSEKEVA